VNPLQLLESIQKIKHPSKDDLVRLIKLHKAFPYFQIPKVLLAKYEKDKAHDESEDMLHFAAITSPDRTWLKQLLENDEKLDNIILSFNPSLKKAIEDKGPQNPDNLIDDLDGELVPSAPKKSDPKERTMLLKKLGEELVQGKSPDHQKPGAKPEEKKGAPANAEIVAKAQDSTEKVEKATPEEKTEPKKRKKQRGDELIESIKKREKKEIHDEKKKEQIDIIKAFSKREIKLATLKEIETQSKQDDLSAKSTKLNPTLVSESYAKLLLKQGKKQKAKEIYKKLMVKFPDKNTYFADLIKDLEENKS
jgi:hypothetical protein